MDAKQCMIVDLERRGDKNMFITEQILLVYFNIIEHVYFILHMENRLIFMKKGYMLEINV